MDMLFTPWDNMHVHSDEALKHEPPDGHRKRKVIMKKKLRQLLAGLAAGDSIGASSEFTAQERVPQVYERYREQGWPFKAVGGGSFGWAPGEPTDDTDMAMCIVRAFLAHGEFNPEAIGQEFVGWLNTRPRDIGNTTARTLGRLRDGVPWFEAGRVEYDANPNGAANGSLMRNGVVAAMAENLDDALTFTLQNGIITHFAPLPVICCAAQTWAIWRLLEGTQPFVSNWVNNFESIWSEWLDDSTDPYVTKWHEHIGADRLEQAWETFREACWSPDAFDPFKTNFAGRAGYCLLTLQIAVWASYCSSRGPDAIFPTPDGFPPEVFEKRGAWCVGWPGMIGEDADTYGAAAGPLIAAEHGPLPESMAEGLMALKEFDALSAKHA
jgi:ADP-ribosylglycohydrolase